MLSQEELRIVLESVSTKKLTKLLDKYKVYILEPKITKLDIIDTIILLKGKEIPDKEIMKLIREKRTKKTHKCKKVRVKRKVKPRRKRNKKIKRKR